MPVATAGADPDTGRFRVLDCGPSGSLTVVLDPNAFSASVPAFHDVGSNAVLVPLNVRVNGRFTLRAAPGVVDSRANVVTCSYTDPAGLVPSRSLIAERHSDRPARRACPAWKQQ